MKVRVRQLEWYHHHICQTHVWHLLKTSYLDDPVFIVITLHSYFDIGKNALFSNRCNHVLVSLLYQFQESNKGSCPHFVLIRHVWWALIWSYSCFLWTFALCAFISAWTKRLQSWSHSRGNAQSLFCPQTDWHKVMSVVYFISACSSFIMHIFPYKSRSLTFPLINWKNVTIYFFLHFNHYNHHQGYYVFHDFCLSAGLSKNYQTKGCDMAQERTKQMFAQIQTKEQISN